MTRRGPQAVIVAVMLAARTMRKLGPNGLTEREIALPSFPENADERLKIPHGGFVSAVGQERSMAGALDRFRQTPLILRTHAGHAPGYDLAAFGDETRHQRRIA